VRLAPGAPKDVTIHRDDVSLGAAAFEVPLPVDPGSHVITAAAAGRQTRSYPVTVREGDRVVVEVEPGPEAGAAPAEAAPVARPELPPAGGESPPAATAWQKDLSYVAGGLGIVGVGVGSFFGLQALSKWSSAKSDCAAGCSDGSAARTERNDATTDATISTISFAVGGVALAGAIVLFVTAPSSARTGRIDFGPFTTPGGGGMMAAGAF
jgi:hypothetical protein